VTRRTPPADGSPWRCHIKIKREYDQHGHALHEVPPELPFCTVTRKEDIVVCVTAAQASLLNPGAVDREDGSYSAFVPCGLGEDPRPSDAFRRVQQQDDGFELEFTPNSVVLEIQGHEVRVEPQLPHGCSLQLPCQPARSDRFLREITFNRSYSCLLRWT
jgi:hypothetical protein